MCDIHKKDRDSFVVDGEMISVAALNEVVSWQDVATVIGQDKAGQMREFNFNPNEIVRFMEKVSGD